MRSAILAMLLFFCCGASVTGAAGEPLSAHPGAKPDAGARGETQAVTGKVLETMDSGGYTYIKLSMPQGEVWAAVSPAMVTVGESVTIVDAMVMHNFDARSLGRKFDQIIFGNLAGSASSPPHGSTPQESVPTTRQVEKASGADGRTVAEVWAQRMELKDKPVALRGQVVKFNGAIMGRNWLHLQDGTGTPAASNFDLVVTSHDTVKVGDVIVVRGVVHVDKDFGAGYAYPVVVEDAKIEQ
jgi:hypothetical protein